MKKLQRALSVFTMMLTACLTLPSMAQAAETTKSIGDNLSLLYCIPFAGILLCIAICPLVAGEWWEKRKPIVVAFWSLAFLIPFAIAVGMGTAWEELLEAIIGDYLTFIVLLFGLFCVAGNVSLEGDLVGKPKLNVLLLIISTLLSSWIGTTGASMLMIRPMIRANKWRRRKVQVMVFFIFLVSNIGGCLTPVGDPPLLMGFMNGVDFFWSLNLLPVMILNVVLLLALFYVIDSRAYKKDLAEGAKQPEVSGEHKKLRLNGAHNIIFLLMIIVAVILSGVLPKTVPFFKGSIHFYGEVELGFAKVIVLRPPMIYGRGSKGNYPVLAKLAKKLPVFPEADNERSMLYIENLCEFLCQVMLVEQIKQNATVLIPQNAEWTNTSVMVEEIAKVSGKKIAIMKALKPAVAMTGKLPGKIGGMTNKAFGNSCYTHAISVYPGLDYQKISLKQSVDRTESVKSENSTDSKEDHT